MPLQELAVSFYVLAGIYSLLIFFPFIQLIRIARVGQPLCKPTTQKTFLVLLLCTAACMFHPSSASLPLPSLSLLTNAQAYCPRDVFITSSPPFSLLFSPSLTNVLIVRTSFFLIVPLTNGDATFNITNFSNPLLTILDDFGCIVFFTTFTLLILFWYVPLVLAQHHPYISSSISFSPAH